MTYLRPARTLSVRGKARARATARARFRATATARGRGRARIEATRGVVGVVGAGAA